MMARRVAVVGAGPAGVCAVAALQQAGAHVLWVDRNVTATTEGASDAMTTPMGRAGCHGNTGGTTGFGTVGRFGHFSGVHRLVPL